MERELGNQRQLVEDAKHNLIGCVKEVLDAEMERRKKIDDFLGL